MGTMMTRAMEVRMMRMRSVEAGTMGMVRTRTVEVRTMGMVRAVVRAMIRPICHCNRGNGQHGDGDK